MTHPDGSTSTEAWNRNNATGFWETQLFNATAPAGHRRSKVFISTNSGLHSNGNFVATVTGLTRRVENGESEITYGNRRDSNGKWIVYEGGRSAFEVLIGNATKGFARHAPLLLETPPQAAFFTMDLAAVPRVTALSKTNGNNFRETSRTDAFGRSVLSPTRNPVTLSITRSEKPDGTAADYIFNAFDTPATVTDRLGRVSQREFDANGNITRETRGFGTAAASTTEAFYNAQGLVTEKRDPLYDPEFPDLHSTTYEYYGNHLPKKIIHPADYHDGPRPETNFTWDAAGRLDTVTDPLGRTVTYDYDDRSRLVTTTYSDTSTEVIAYGTGSEANLVVSRTDRNGIVTAYDYDDADRPVLTTNADGLAEEVTESCQYLVGTRLESICTKRGEKTEYGYDYRNRLVSTTRHADADTALTSTTELDILGRTRSTTDPYGRRTFFLYDQNDRINRTVTETVPNGLGTVPAFSNTATQTAEQIEREIELTNGETITLRGIHEVTYSDARDLFLKNLTRVLTPNAAYLITDQFTDAEGQTLTTKDSRGIESLSLYDVLGRTVRSFEAITLPEERLSETDYDKASNVVEIRHPRHFTEVDENDDPIRAVERFAYNGRNLRATHTVAADHPTLEASQSWLYNLDGTLFRHSDFKGNPDLNLWHTCCGKLQARIDRDEQSTTIHNSDFKGNPTHTATVSEDPSEGGTASPEWHDPEDSLTVRETTTRFDGLDRPTHQTRWIEPLGFVDDDARATLGTGNVPIATNPALGLTTTYTYDEDLTDGQGIDLTYAAQLTELENRGVTFNADADGYATAVTNPEGETSVQIQDGIGRTVMLINGEGHIQTVRHDEMLPAATMIPGHLSAIPVPGDLLTTVQTNALGHQTTTFTDGAGRTLLVQDPAGNLSGMAFDANSNLAKTRDANGLGQDCEYDSLNRDTECADLQEQTETVSRSKTYNAHGALLTSTDAEGHVTTNTYDVRDRLATTEDPNQIVTSYGYDANNNLRTLTDGENHTRAWFFDARNLNIAKQNSGATPPASGSTHVPEATPPAASATPDVVTCLYDALARLTLKTAQDSSTINHIYDLAGRMTDREYSDNTIDSFEYDAASRLTKSTKGRYGVITDHTYFPDSQPESETFTFDSRTYSVSRTYDAHNRPETHTFGDGNTQTWLYDARDNVTATSYEGNSIITQQNHDPAGRLTGQTFGNGLARVITYSRLDNLRVTDIVSEGSQAIETLSMSYTYTPDKQVETETFPNGSPLAATGFNADYDPGNRVTAYTRAGGVNPPTQTWQYDDNGNWTSNTLAGQTENRTHNADNEITSGGTAFDARGNMTQDADGNEYHYDLDNRIFKIEMDNGPTVDLLYDATGRRVQSKQGSTKTAYLWWGDQECSEHKHQSGQAVIQNDLWAHPTNLNTIIARAVDGSKFKMEWYHKNYLDHVYAVTDDDGDIIEQYRYSAFGIVEFYDPAAQPIAGSAIANPVLWNSRRYDEATTLFYYKYRHYIPKLGRWPSRDPKQEWGGENLYSFSNQSPTSNLDLFGLLPFGTAVVQSWINQIDIADAMQSVMRRWEKVYGTEMNVLRYNALYRAMQALGKTANAEPPNHFTGAGQDHRGWLKVKWDVDCSNPSSPVINSFNTDSDPGYTRRILPWEEPGYDKAEELPVEEDRQISGSVVTLEATHYSRLGAEGRKKADLASGGAGVPYISRKIKIVIDCNKCKSTTRFGGSMFPSHKGYGIANLPPLAEVGKRIQTDVGRLVIPDFDGEKLNPIWFARFDSDWSYQP